MPPSEVPKWWLDEFGEYEGWGEFAWETMQKYSFSRDTQIPLSVVKALLAQQSDFNKSLVDLLGLHLEKAAKDYRDALNPPLEMGNGSEMTYSSMTDEEDDLMYQIETGQISLDKVPDSLRKLIRDTDISIDPS